MESAAHSLPTLPRKGGQPLELHLLTGRRFWYQTAFCLWTFAQHSGRALRAVIYDDGTLTAVSRESLQRVIPTIVFESQSAIVERLDHFLPQSRFPVLRERWQHYPNIRKLTDVHVGRSGWKLVLDSDLLFFRRPDFLLQWLDDPRLPLHAVDCETSYGYSRELMNKLCGASVVDLVNVGLTGLNSSSLDWDMLERWCAILIEKEKTHYFLEQAIIAMIVAGKPCAVAPPKDYVTKPRTDGDCSAVMHHYVANTKRSYFRRCWKVALETALKH